MAQLTRNQFIQVMVASVTSKQEIEQQLLTIPTHKLSAKALAHLDESALDTVDALTFDFPSPTSNGIVSLVKAIVLWTSPNPRESLFSRTFALSTQFIDGVIYCCSRHTTKKEKEAEAELNTHSGALSSDLAAVVFVKCVRFILEAPLPIVSRLLSDLRLEISPIQTESVTTIAEEQVDASVEKMIAASHSSSPTPSTVEHVAYKSDEEEVWATELDDDDVPYEGTIRNISLPAYSAPNKTTNFANGYSGKGYTGGNDILTPQVCLGRLGYVIQGFNSSFLNGMSTQGWKEYGLVSDICAIVRHLSPTKIGASSILLEQVILEDGTVVGLPPWVDQGWVEYTYALRDSVTSETRYDSEALQFLLSELDPIDQSDDSDMLNPSRCISIVVLHSIVKSQCVKPLAALRVGLLERLDVLSECVASVSDALTAVVAAGTEDPSHNTATYEDEDIINSDLSKKAMESKNLIYEQSKVLIVLISFAVGISVNSDAVSSPKMLTSLPPASTLIRSQLLRNVLKLLCVLSVKPSFKEDAPNPLALGMQLVVTMTAHSTELAEFTIRTPMGSTLLESSHNDSTTLLAVVLAASGVGRDSSLGGRLNGIAQEKCQVLLDPPNVEGGYLVDATTMLGAIAHWNPLALARVRNWMGSKNGSWYREIVNKIQRLLTEKPIHSANLNKNTAASTETSTAIEIEKDHGRNEEVQDEAALRNQPGVKRGMEKRNTVARADAIKGAKLLLEVFSGSSKTD